MYFTVFNYDIKVVLHAIDDFDKMHKLIMSMFDGDRSEESVTYYVDDNHSEIIVQSKNKPHVANGLSISYQEEIDYDKFVGDRVCFEIHVNPLRQDIERRKKKLITNREDRLRWVCRKIENMGGSVLRCEEKSVSTNRIAKSGCKSRPMQVFTYYLIADIFDKEKFIEGCSHGVGQQKSYGAGLALPFIW